MSSVRKLIPWIFMAFLSACVSAPEGSNVPDLTFANVPPVSLNVAKIDIINDYKSPLAAPNVEHLFKTSAADAAQTLLARQLVATGGGGTLRAVIEDASVISEQIPVKKDFWNTFSRLPVERFKAKVSMRFEYYNDSAPDIIVGHADLTADRSKVLLEGTSPAERENIFFTMIEELMRDISGSLPKTVSYAVGSK